MPLRRTATALAAAQEEKTRLIHFSGHSPFLVHHLSRSYPLPPIDVSFPNAVKYKNPPPKRKLQRGSVKSVMKKKGKEEGVLFPSQRRGAQYGSFRTLEG